MDTRKKFNVRVIAFVGMLGALSAVLMQFKLPLPFAPSFLKFDIAELPGLFAGFFLGPVAGCAVAFVKIILHLIIEGTDTAFVGEFSNIVGSCCFILIAAFIYQAHRTKKGALAALVVSSIVVSVLFIFLNAWVMFPFYVKFYGMPMEAIIAMGSKVNPLVKDTMTLMLFSVFPFNLVKHGVTSLVTYLIYKKSANALRSILKVETRKSKAERTAQAAPAEAPAVESADATNKAE